MRNRLGISDGENNAPKHLQCFLGGDSSVALVSNWGSPHCTQAISCPPCSLRGSQFHCSPTRLSFICTYSGNLVGTRFMLSRAHSRRLAPAKGGFREVGSFSCNDGQIVKTSRHCGCSQSATNSTIGRTPCILGAIFSRSSFEVYRVLVVNATPVQAKRTHTVPHCRQILPVR